MNELKDLYLQFIKEFALLHTKSVVASFSKNSHRIISRMAMRKDNNSFYSSAYFDKSFLEVLFCA